MFSDLGRLFIRAREDHPGWQDDIDSSEWLALLHLFTTMETLHVSGRLAGQVARALKDVRGEKVTEVLPALQQLSFEGYDRWVESTEHFVSASALWASYNHRRPGSTWILRLKDLNYFTPRSTTYENSAKRMPPCSSDVVAPRYYSTI